MCRRLCHHRWRVWGKVASLGVLLLGGLVACTSSAAGSTSNTRPGVRMTITSRYPFDRTMQLLESALRTQCFSVFGIVDYREAAHKQNLDIQPAKLMVVGFPKIGTPLMLEDPYFLLRVPLYLMVTDVRGKTRVSFHNTRGLMDSYVELSDMDQAIELVESIVKKTLAE